MIQGIISGRYGKTCISVSFALPEVNSLAPLPLRRILPFMFGNITQDYEPEGLALDRKETSSNHIQYHASMRSRVLLRFLWRIIFANATPEGKPSVSLRRVMSTAGMRLLTRYVRRT